MRSILVIAFALFIISESKAQLDISIKAGGNSSDWIWTPQTDNFEDVQYFNANRWGYQLGLSNKYSFGKKFNLITDLLFVKKGAGSIHLNYINLPTLLGYNLGRFNIEFGPELGVLLLAKQKTNSQNQNITSAFSTFDLSLVGGVSFSATEKIDLNLKFIQGIIPNDTFLITDDGASGTEVKIYNRSIQFSVAYQLNKN
ncbi:MAG: porin family protein [Bacteroidota bacterium]